MERYIRWFCITLALFLLFIHNLGYADIRNMSLIAGGNYIGCPLDPDAGFSAFDILNQLGSTNVYSAYRYNTRKGKWDSAYWFFGKPTGVDFDIKVGEGYGLWCLSDCNLEFPGTPIGAFNYTFDLLQGQNIFSIPNPSGYTGYDMMLNLGEENAYVIWKYVNQSWEVAMYWDSGTLYVVNDDYLEFDPDTCYQIYMYNTVMDWSPEVQIEVEEIMFNHNTSSISSDGVNIRENFSTPFTIPEWTKQGRNDPCCYKKSNDVTIKAKFSITPPITASARIRAESTDSNGSLGDVLETEVSFSSGISGYVQFSVSGLTPSSINKTTTDQWQWYFRDVNGGGLPEKTSNISGPHTVYTILAAPEAPWTTSYEAINEPWTVVLDYSCDWAEGENNEEEIIEEIVEHIYEDIGLEYDTIGGESQYTQAKDEDFELTDFLDDMPDVGKFACYDGGKALKTFANVLGCELEYKYSSTVPGSCFGNLNCVKPAGKDWTNNPFYDFGYPNSPHPIVPGDYTYYFGNRSFFGNHALCALGNDYYDPTMKVDTDNNPDDPPHSVDWIFGWSWSTYKSKVIDNFPLPPCPPCFSAAGDPNSFDFSIE